MAQERIGRYSILEEIASGGQGAVYRAFDAETNQIIALKLLHPSLTGDQNYLERFHREASLASSIDHPNVIKIYEVGESEGRHFIAMELSCPRASHASSSPRAACPSTAPPHSPSRSPTASQRLTRGASFTVT